MTHKQNSSSPNPPLLAATDLSLGDLLSPDHHPLLPLILLTELHIPVMVANINVCMPTPDQVQMSLFSPHPFNFILTPETS